MIAGRELYWNIDAAWLMYVLMLAAVLICAAGLYRRITVWRKGSNVSVADVKRRLMTVFRESVLQRRLMKNRSSGFLHMGLFLGFIICFIGTSAIAIQEYLHIPVFQGNIYLWLTLLLDVLGALALLAGSAALVRRYVIRAKRVNTDFDKKPFDFSLILLVLILATGFVIESLRIAGTGDPWAAWSPVGFALSALWQGLSFESVRLAFQINWWFHAVLAAFFIALLPRSRMLHIITAPVSQFLGDTAAKNALPAMDLEADADHFGMAALEDYSLKNLIDTSSCTRCGRCEEHCPANITGHNLSPKRLVQSLSNQTIEGLSKPELADDIWQCTTCGACEEQCPVLVQHLRLVTGWRRYNVLTEDEYPEGLQLLYRNLEKNSNPWGQGWAERGNWNDGSVKVFADLAEGERVEYLFWVGCAGSFDSRNIKTTKVIAELLQKAGISFAVLGSEERCCGDPARRTGNEYLSQISAMENVEIFKKYGIKKMITACPHCFNMFSYEYKQYGFEPEVFHHSQILFRFIEQSVLAVAHSGGRAAYHDPCYLGRYNRVYDAPRSVLTAAYGLRELGRNRTDSFCCGAGGGGMWMESEGEGINKRRAEEALASGADCLAVACPYCLTMMEDALAGTDLKVSDISELLLSSLKESADENSGSD